MAEAHAPQGVGTLGRLAGSTGFQVNSGGEAEGLATDANDITG